ncbi:unnamed protein product [Penicillium salamii]|uniref:Phosphoserine phosphatase n=1 Tax=Penicillium salamii TaxID=1612424 RepID=A0A9W4JWU0_9EURO|nr:unnamed protein product [Penicillium salamii]
MKQNLELTEARLPYLEASPKAIFFTDFDGTITLDDCNDHLVDNFGFGVEKRRMLELEVLKGNVTFRDAFQAMLDSVHLPFNDCLRIIQENVRLDPHFLDFYHWAKEHNVPIVILSSGMTPVIHALLASMVGSEPENIFVIANDVEPRSGKEIDEGCGWRIKYRDDSEFGHDKSLEIKPYGALPDQHRPLLLYAGDGVSDLSAASETDILFAKDGLVTYCEQKDIEFVPFSNWISILDSMRDIHKGIEKPDPNSAGQSVQDLKV